MEHACGDSSGEPESKEIHTTRVRSLEEDDRSTCYSMGSKEENNRQPFACMPRCANGGGQVGPGRTKETPPFTSCIVAGTTKLLGFVRGQRDAPRGWVTG